MTSLDVCSPVISNPASVILFRTLAPWGRFYTAAFRLFGVCSLNPPARNTLAQQPTETLDRIVFHIPQQRDLLALALCSKR